MVQNVFKLCMIVTSLKYYKYTLLSVTFDLYLGHGVSANVKFLILNYAVVFVVIFIKLGMIINTVEFYP